ncbi:hypothetical protein ABZ917_17265 [Nonomuraea wenchangensis]
MPISVNSSAPALVSDNGEITSVTTASFTRPAAGSLLVAITGATSETAPTVSGGGLTWTRRVQRTGSDCFAEIWTAPVTGSGSMTVTLGNLTAVGDFLPAAVGAIKVVSVAGQHPTNPIGTTGSGTSSANTLNVTAYNATTAGSRGFFSAVDAIGTGVPTSSDTGFGYYEDFAFGATAGMCAYKAADSGAPGAAVTINADAAGSESAGWLWAALEIVPEPSSRITAAVVSRAAVYRAANW